MISNLALLLLVFRVTARQAWRCLSVCLSVCLCLCICMGEGQERNRKATEDADANRGDEKRSTTKKQPLQVLESESTAYTRNGNGKITRRNKTHKEKREKKQEEPPFKKQEEPPFKPFPFTPNLLQ